MNFAQRALGHNRLNHNLTAVVMVVYIVAAVVIMMRSSAPPPPEFYDPQTDPTFPAFDAVENAPVSDAHRRPAPRGPDVVDPPWRNCEQTVNEIAQAVFPPPVAATGKVLEKSVPADHSAQSARHRSRGSPQAASPQAMVSMPGVGDAAPPARVADVDGTYFRIPDSARTKPP